MRGITCLTEDLFASVEGLCSMELVCFSLCLSVATVTYRKIEKRVQILSVILGSLGDVPCQI